MFPSSDSYLAFQRSIDDALNFAVLVSYGMPTLVTAIGPIPETHEVRTVIRPDFFVHDHSRPLTLRKYAGDYQSTLASLTLLSAFSLFESYVHGLLDELVNFHGGDDAMPARVRARTRANLVKHPSADVETARDRLKTRFDKGKTQRYSKYLKVLSMHGIRLPSEALAYLGAKTLVERKKRIKAYELLRFVESVFVLDIDRSEHEEFECIRELRNQVAHGGNPKVTTKQALDGANALKRLATKIDKRASQHFFMIERS